MTHKEVATLKQMTVRGIPDELTREIKKEAKKKKISLNRAFLSLLEKKTGIKESRKKEMNLYHDLDHLSGIWSEQEAGAFKKTLELQRKIDEDLWKNRE